MAANDVRRSANKAKHLPSRLTAGFLPIVHLTDAMARVGLKTKSEVARFTGYSISGVKKWWAAGEVPRRIIMQFDILTDSQIRRLSGIDETRARAEGKPRASGHVRDTNWRSNKKGMHEVVAAAWLEEVLSRAPAPITATGLQRAFGMGSSTIARWRERGRIPAQSARAVWTYLRDMGIAVEEPTVFEYTRKDVTPETVAVRGEPSGEKIF